eukprot:scaffold9278_cov170-Cylindrotheca_fusiformis.AAC.5
MVALDLDGTLLSSTDRQIAKVQAEYLKNLHQQGFVVAIATGRAASGVYEHAKQLGIPDLPVVCSNGARAFHYSTSATTTTSSSSNDNDKQPKQQQHRELFFNPVSKDVVERTIRFANANGYAIQYYHDDRVYANSKVDSHFRMTALYSEYTGVRIDHVQDDFASLLEQDHLPSKLLVLFDEMQAAHARSLVHKEFTPDQATVVKGYCTWFMEILSTNVNKGIGLQKLCTFMNIDLEDVIAIGDGCNDIEFLQMAGLGVAVHNAKPEVKQVADLSLEYTNDQHGVMKILQQLQANGSLHTPTNTTTI